MPNNLSLSLRDAEPPKKIEDTVPESDAQALSAREVKRLLKLLPDMEESDIRDFAFRKETIRPSRTGKDIKTPFPPKEKIPLPPAIEKYKPKELTIRNYSPQGFVHFAPKLSITFSSPMIALSSFSRDT